MLSQKMIPAFTVPQLCGKNNKIEMCLGPVEKTTRIFARHHGSGMVWGSFPSEYCDVRGHDSSCKLEEVTPACPENDTSALPMFDSSNSALGAQCIMTSAVARSYGYYDSCPNCDRKPPVTCGTDVPYFYSNCNRPNYSDYVLHNPFKR